MCESQRTHNTTTSLSDSILFCITFGEQSTLANVLKSYFVRDIETSHWQYRRKKKEIWINNFWTVHIDKLFIFVLPSVVAECQWNSTKPYLVVYFWDFIVAEGKDVIKVDHIWDETRYEVEKIVLWVSSLLRS